LTRGNQPNQMGANLPAVSLPGAAAQTVAGTQHTCVRLVSGSVHCWGRNNLGQLGLGDADDRSAPGARAELGTGLSATFLAVGGRHTCAALDSGDAKCWGHESSIGIGPIGITEYNTKHRGDAPGEMGDAMPAVDLLGQAPAPSDSCALPPSNGCVARWKLVRPTCSPKNGPFVTFGPSGLTIRRIGPGGDVALELATPPADNFSAVATLSMSGTASPALRLQGANHDVLGVGDLNLFSSLSQTRIEFVHPGGSTYTASPTVSSPPLTFSIAKFGPKVHATVTGGATMTSLTHQGNAQIQLAPHTSGSFSGTISKFELTAPGATWIDTFACNSIAP